MTAILVPIAQAVLSFVYTKLAAFLGGLIAGWIAKHQIQKRADQDAQPMKDAKTGQEIDDATDSTLGHL